jgi:hypothetical protein
LPLKTGTGEVKVFEKTGTGRPRIGYVLNTPFLTVFSGKRMDVVLMDAWENIARRYSKKVKTRH